MNYKSISEVLSALRDIVPGSAHLDDVAKWQAFRDSPAGDFLRWKLDDTCRLWNDYGPFMMARTALDDYNLFVNNISRVGLVWNDLIAGEYK